jgi:hypothetical protein
MHAPKPGTHIAIPIVATLGGALVGAVVGLVVGANIGGNWFTSFSFGGQRGYEATAMIGAWVGAIALGGTCLWLALRRRAR